MFRLLTPAPTGRAHGAQHRAASASAARFACTPSWDRAWFLGAFPRIGRAGWWGRARGKGGVQSADIMRIFELALLGSEAALL